MYILKRFLGNEFDCFNNIIEKYNVEQNEYINLTACVSYPYQEVLDVMAMPLTTVPTEGTRGQRYFPSVDSMEEIEDYAERLALKLFNINNTTEYKVSIQPNSGTQANQIVYNALLKDGDCVLALSPKDGGHISHSKLGNRAIKSYYIALDSNLDIDYSDLEYMIKKTHPKLVIIGASSYIKEFDYKKIYQITSSYNVPLMADICHSVLYIMSGIHKSIFPYVDFATFTMDKLLRGPQGGVLIYRTLYEKAINASIFPKTQGGPMQHNMFAKAMCFLKLSSEDLYKYSRLIIKNATILFEQINNNGLKTVNTKVDNHIILLDLTQTSFTGMEAEKSLFKHRILCNRNQIPDDPQNAMVTSGIRFGTVQIILLGYSDEDLRILGDYISSILLCQQQDTNMLEYLIQKYHKNINISN